MLGHPKYNYGDIVVFKLNDKEITGSVFIIDRYGTFEDKSDVSYDIMTLDCLYKHIPEKDVELLMESPIIDNRIVFDINFAYDLNAFLSSITVDNPDDELMRESLQTIAELLLKYQKYTCRDKEEQKFLDQVKEQQILDKLNEEN